MIFIDCTGTAMLGLLAGAQTCYGQESQLDYGESLAPERRDDMHHGNTVFFRTRIAEAPAPSRRCRGPWRWPRTSPT